MQPYLFPYIGYFQLISSVDIFVIYDNIKYTKKGWVNRNRFLLNGMAQTFSVPLKKDSDFRHIADRELSPDFSPQELISRFQGAYGKAPFWNETSKILETILHFDEKNLFRFISNSICHLSNYFGLHSNILKSSDIPANHFLKGQDRVISICKALGATTYINPPGGIGLYDAGVFDQQGLELRFLSPGIRTYRQFNQTFVPHLSIVDVLAFNSKIAVEEEIRQNFRIH
jgi:hypothetical protein